MDNSFKKYTNTQQRRQNTYLKWALGLNNFTVFLLGIYLAVHLYMREIMYAQACLLKNCNSQNFVLKCQSGLK